MPRSKRPLAALRRFLHRSPARAAALAGGVLVLTAVAYAGTPAYQARLDQLARESAAARQRAGLSGTQACAQDPTPEMSFSNLVRAKAGSTFTLEARGHFAKGTHFVFRSDHVHVVGARITARGATVTGRIDPRTLPGTVALTAVGPLCPAETSFDAVKVESHTVWKLELDNGWSCHLDAPGIGEDRHDCKATWSGGGHTKHVPCVLKENGDGSFQAGLGGAQAAQDRAMKALGTVSDPAVVKAQAEAQKALSGMDRCEKEHDQAKQMACIQAVTKKVTALQAKVRKAQDAALERSMKGAFGCGALDLTVDGRKVSVDASGCGYPDAHQGRGTVTVE